MSDICAKLHGCLNRMERHSFPIPQERIPKNGIYLLFEKGEAAHGGRRIVRVGTHRGDDQLCNRLMEHFVKENKDRSIFRKNIGRCLLHREGDSFAADWERDLTGRDKGHLRSQIDLARQKGIEAQVSSYIRNRFSFVVIEVRDAVDRLRLESRLISTVSRCDECRPSPEWLGLCSPKQRIRESGLWLVNELYKEPLSSAEYGELFARCDLPS